jgi:hypothetical protein
VHQLIHGYVAGRTAETWIVLKKNKQEIEVLQAHYGGEGKKTFRTKQVESLHKTLQYKNGRAMTFEKFSEAQQVRLSFDKVQHPSLETTKSSLLVSWFPGFVYLATDENVDYNYWNSLSTEVASLLPEFVPATVKHLQPVSVELMGKFARDSTRTSRRCLLKTRRSILKSASVWNITPKKQKNRYGPGRCGQAK